MKMKTFKVDSLSGGDKIIIASKGLVVDFAKECTHVAVYFDDFTKPHYDLYAEIFIENNNQPQTTIFKLPIKGKNATVVVEAITNFDIEKITVSISS